MMAQKRTDTRDAGRALREAGIRYERAFTDKRKTTGSRTKFWNVSNREKALIVVSEWFPGYRVEDTESRGGVVSVVVWR